MTQGLQTPESTAVTREAAADPTDARSTGSPRVSWKVRVPAGADLSRRLLGLTLVERRLREARKWGVDRVYFVLPEEGDPSSIPPLGEPSLCAPYTVVGPGEPCATDEERIVDVPLFAVLDPPVPPSGPEGTRREDSDLWTVAIELDPDGDWTPAVDRYRHWIVEESAAGWVSDRLNKPVSLFLSTRLADTPVTANQWSWFNLLVGVASGWFVAREPWWAVALGGLLFQLASIFDGVDGEIAKFRLESSRFGAWLDTAVDTAGLLAFLTGSVVHVARHGPLDPSTVAVLGGAGGVILAVYLGVQLHFCLTRLGTSSLAAWTGRFVSELPQSDPVVRLVQSLGVALKKDFFSLLFFAIALTGQMQILLYLVTTALAVGLFSLVYLNTRYGRRVHELGL